MRPELFIANRLSPSEANGEKAPVGVRIGVAGVTLAFVVMLLSLAVVTGFKNEIRRKVTGYESQIVIQGRQTEQAQYFGELSTVALNARIRHDIAGTLGSDVTTATVTDVPVLLKTDSAFSALILRTVDPSFDRSFIRDNIVDGTWDSDSAASQIVISEPTAAQLGLGVGDRVYAHFFRSGAITTRRYTIEGIFNTYFDDYDRHFAFADGRLGHAVTRLPDSLATSIMINGIGDDVDLETASSALESAIVFDALSEGGSTSDIPSVSNVRQRGAMYLNWLDLLDTNVVVILSLMAVVAGFTLISSLFILILERVPMIGLLKAVGARDSQIRGIFIWLCEKIVLRGLLLGNIIGLTLYFIQHIWHVMPLDAEAYYLSYVPTSLSFTTWLLLNAGVIAGSFIVLVLPSHIITRMSPVDCLRRDTQGDE